MHVISYANKLDRNKELNREEDLLLTQYVDLNIQNYEVINVLEMLESE